LGRNGKKFQRFLWGRSQDTLPRAPEPLATPLLRMAVEGRYINT